MCGLCLPYVLQTSIRDRGLLISSKYSDWEFRCHQKRKKKKKKFDYLQFYSHGLLTIYTLDLCLLPHFCIRLEIQCNMRYNFI